MMLARSLLTVIAIVASALPQARREPIYDDQIEVLRPEPAEYPHIAQGARIQGTVVVEVVVEADHSVSNAVALSGSKLLIPTAEANARQWKIRSPVSGRALVVYDFSINPHKTCGEGDPNSTFALKHAATASIVACTPPFTP